MKSDSSNLRISRRILLASSFSAMMACRKVGQPRDGRLHLSFYAWADATELNAFREIIRRYEATHRDLAIDFHRIAYEDRTHIDILLASGLGPDLFRVEYQEIGKYTPSGSLIDLSPYLPRDYAAGFSHAPWQAVLHQGRPHALPHHTDTSVIYYNRKLFRDLEIQVPEQLGDSWGWKQFISVAQRIKRKLPFAFAVNWTLGGSFRWLNFLYQHGGTLTDSVGHPAICSQAAYETLGWTQRFFTEELVPPSDSAQGTEQVENLFANQLVGMYFDVGPQAMQAFHTDFEWATTFLPKDLQAASELGGNAIGISRDCKHPGTAADFALFLTNERNMRDFVSAAQFLPVRTALNGDQLTYQYRPDVMRVHLEQATTVPLNLARAVTRPDFHKVHRVLGEELDQAFVGKQRADVTLERIAQGMKRASLT